MNLKQLVYFRKTVETGNMTLAAAALNVAPTALGLQIRNLEDELGTALLVRHSRGVRSTSGGELFLRHAIEILDRIDSAKAAVRSHAGMPVDALRLGLTPSLVRLVGNAILTELQPMLRGIDLTLVEELSFVLMRLLETGELDCALTFSQVGDARYDRRALLEEELFLMVPCDAPGDGPVAFREICDYELALTSKRDVISQELDAIATRLGLRLNVSYKVQSLRALKNLVAKGVAATVMPIGAADAELRQGAFRARPIHSPAVIRTLAFVVPRDRLSEPVHERMDGFIDAVADRLHAVERARTRRL